MDDFDFWALEQGLAADAGYIAHLVTQGDQPAVTAYIRDTGYLERMAQWKAARA